MSEDIIIGKEYMSNNYGPFVVLENLGYIHNARDKYYKIQFKWSNNISQSTKRHILTGAVGDAWYGININQIQYSNNYGPFKVIDIIIDKQDNNRRIMKIKFCITGTEKYVNIMHIKSGCIKDEYVNPLIIKPVDTTLLQPNIKEHRIYWKLYQIYKNMKNRCIDSKNKSFKNYGKYNIKICDRWLNSFDNFYNDVKLLPQYEKFERWPTLYELDKDYLQLSIPKEQRVYSPETCMFLYYMDNLNICVYEYTRDNINTILSKYYGVNKVSDNAYRVKIGFNHKNIDFGIYNNEIAAANMYNHIYDYYHKYVYPRHEIFPLINNVSYMSWNECMQYRTSSRLLYTLTNEPTISIPEFIEKYKVTKDDIIN